MTACSDRAQRRPLRRVPTRAAVVGLALLLLGAACVRAPHARYREAEAAYRTCLASEPGAPEACEALEAERDQAYEDYERAAERNWTCRNTVDGCERVP